MAGFLCYPLDTLREEEGAQKIFDFRDKLEETLTTDDGSEVLILTGGATGLYYGYVDFISWDIRTALKMAQEFFEDSDIPWASFHTFRHEAGSVRLKKSGNNGPEGDKAGGPESKELQDEEHDEPEVYAEEETDRSAQGRSRGCRSGLG